MTTWDNRRLSDLATRSQILIEGVKSGGVIALNQIIRDMFEDMSGIMSRSKYKDLSLLTKGELRLLLRALNDVKTRAYSRYVEYAMEWLRDFCDIHAKAQRVTWAYSRFSIDRQKDKAEEDDTDQSEIFTEKEANDFIIAFVPPFKRNVTPGLATSNDRLWQDVTNRPIPASGMYVLPSYQLIIEEAAARVNNAVRTGYSTPGVSGADVSESLTHENKQGGSSALTLTLTYSTTALVTAVQHASQIITNAVIGTMFAMYRWYSVIDSRTTDICRGRNLRTYVVGFGPLPPAHRRCRSHVAPIANEAIVGTENMYNWLRRQPHALLAYLFGAAVATAIIDGSIEAEDLPDLVFRPMTFDEYLAHTYNTLDD